MEPELATKIRLEGDMIVPLNVPRPTTYADTTNLASQFPHLAEQILALPLPPPTAVDEESPNTHHGRQSKGRGGRKPKTHAPRRTSDKSSASPAPTPASSMNAMKCVNSPTAHGTSIVRDQTPRSIQYDIEPAINRPVNPYQPPAPIGPGPSMNEVDALVLLLQKARTTDPGLRNMTLFEVETALKITEQIRSQPDKILPMGHPLQLPQRTDFASSGGMANGQMNQSPQLNFQHHVPIEPRATRQKQLDDLDHRFSARDTPPPGIDEFRRIPNPASAWSSPRGSPAPRRLPVRQMPSSLPSSRHSPEPIPRPPWPLSKEELRLQLLIDAPLQGTAAANHTSGCFGPTLDQLTAPGEGNEVAVADADRSNGWIKG